MILKMLKTRLAVALLIWMSASALAAPTLPKALEDVTKLEKPTICFEGWSGWGLYLIDWDGQNQRLWMDNKTRFAGSPAWSPDGRRAAFVVYTEHDNRYTRFLYDLTTKRVLNLSAKADQDLTLINPSWSPDGKWLAYTGYGDFAYWDVYMQNVATGKVKNITNSPTHDDDAPSWSPDGKKLAFSSIRISLDREFIYVIDINGANEIQLTDDFPARDSYPRWSPDGKKIAFQSYGRSNPSSYDLYMMDPDGTNIERVTFDEREKTIETWSPDGKWLTYSMRLVRGKPHDAYRVHVETKEVARMTVDVGVHSPRWVLAGKSRFLSVDPAGKKKAQWGKIKEAKTQKEENAPAEE